MKKMDNTERPEKDIAIARAQFCWETEANSGRVLHYYGDKDGNKNKPSDTTGDRDTQETM